MWLPVDGVQGLEGDLDALDAIRLAHLPAVQCVADSPLLGLVVDAKQRSDDEVTVHRGRHVLSLRSSGPDHES